MTNCGTIIKFIIDNEGKTDYTYHIGIGRFRRIGQKRIACGVEQSAGQKQIRAGVAGERKLGEYQQMNTVLFGVFSDAPQLGKVCTAVCDRDERGCGGNSDKTVFHKILCPFRNLSGFFR